MVHIFGCICRCIVAHQDMKKVCLSLSSAPRGGMNFLWISYESDDTNTFSFRKAIYASPKRQQSACLRMYYSVYVGHVSSEMKNLSQSWLT